MSNFPIRLLLIGFGTNICLHRLLKEDQDSNLETLVFLIMDSNATYEIIPNALFCSIDHAIFRNVIELDVCVT